MYLLAHADTIVRTGIMRGYNMVITFYILYTDEIIYFTIAYTSAFAVSLTVLSRRITARTDFRVGCDVAARSLGSTCVEFP